MANRIEQSDSAAANTLRQVQKRRGTIVEIEGEWFPAPKEKWKIRKVPLREAIVKVLSDGPLGTSGIVHAVRKIRPEAAYPSVAAEIMRLCDPKTKTLVVCGSSGRGALYALANKDAAAPKTRTPDDATAPKTRTPDDATAPKTRTPDDATAPKTRTPDDATAPKTPTTDGLRPTDVLSSKDARPNGVLLNGGAHSTRVN